MQLCMQNTLLPRVLIISFDSNFAQYTYVINLTVAIAVDERVWSTQCYDIAIVHVFPNLVTSIHLIQMTSFAGTHCKLVHYTVLIHIILRLIEIISLLS